MIGRVITQPGACCANIVGDLPDQCRDPIELHFAAQAMAQGQSQRFAIDIIDEIQQIGLDFALRAINVDRYSEMDTVFKLEEKRVCGWMRPVDLVASGDDLPFRDGAVDFVFSSHVIEHFADPLRALEEWRRVARRKVVLVIPHRDRTFDAARPLSTVQELLDRHSQGFTSEEDRHWSVWTRESFVEMCDAAGLAVLDSLDPDDKIGNGFIVVLDAA